MRILTTLCFALLAPLALAQSLTTEQARKFVESLPEVERFSQSIDGDIRDRAFEADIIPEGGTAFAPYSGAVAFLQEQHSDIHQRMQQLVTIAGFDSLNEWATTGDRVVSAYIAAQVSPQDLLQMEQFSPDMLEQMPPELREEVEGMMAMMEAIKKVPQEDIEAITPLLGALSEYMQMD